MYGDLLALCAVKQDIHDLLWQLFNRCIERKVILSCKGFKIHRGNGAAFHRPAAALDRTLTNGFCRIGNDAVDVDLHEYAQPRAFFTSAERIVEREHSRTQFINADAVFGAGIVL